MITFNELRYSPDFKYLIIDASIDNDPLYKDVVIDSIIVDTLNTYLATGPSDNNVYCKQVIKNCCCPTDELEYIVSKDNCLKHVRVKLSIGSGELSDLNIDVNKDLLFVYVKASGVIPFDSPCNSDISTAIGIVYNPNIFYNGIMNHINKSANTCSISNEFIFDILKLNAMDAYIMAGRYDSLISLWNDLTSCLKITSSKCSCCGNR